jgi:hypothetical protein
MNHVTPRGRYIEFDVDSYLYDNDLTPEREQPDNAVATN